MEEKTRSMITAVTVDGATFHDETFHPSTVNFFFGRNGSGKTTVAKTLREPEALEWNPVVDPAETEILIFDEDYLAKNIRSYGKMPGVFMISRKDIDAQMRIDQLKENKKTAEEEQASAIEKVRNALDLDDRAYRELCDSVWKKTRDLAKQFREAQKGFLKDKKRFTAKLMQQYPTNYSLKDAESLYQAAFSPTAKKYEYLHVLPSVELPDSDLMGRQIVTSGSTPFASFVRALNSLSWIQEGHERYHGRADNMCPYCRQKLPDNFEADLASCYDEQYRREMDELEAFLQQYREALNGFYRIMAENRNTDFETPLLDAYKDKLSLFVERGRRNVDCIRDKIRKPETIVAMTDLEGDLEELNDLAIRINEKIRENNDVLDHMEERKQKVTEMVWQMMAYQCQNEIDMYRIVSEEYQARAEAGRTRLQELEAELLQINEDLQEANSRTSNTTLAMEAINRELDANGFRGFRLREKEGTQYAYELVRDDGSVAENLSEGERQILAFLYFYYEVLGSPEDGRQRDKIVVIDGPVSGMDSNSMSMAARLTRNMVDICLNRQNPFGSASENDNIRQIFCLTHNPYFFREVSYDRVSDYRCVSIFELKKDKNNVSTITLCVTDRGDGGGESNYSPVKGYYDCLWEEYKGTEDPTAAVNVMKSILEYFFIRVCGYTGFELRSRLSREKDAGNLPDTDYDLAEGLLGMLDTESNFQCGGVSFDSSRADMDQCRRVFETLFRMMGQERHYRVKTEEE